MEKSNEQSRLWKLKQKASQLDAKIKLIEARQKSQARKNETRKKIIAGALALHHAENNPEDLFSIKLFRLLNEYVVKPYERNLFGLPPLPENSQNSVANDPGHEILNLTGDFQAEK